jgi:hypothetical protein
MIRITDRMSAGEETTEKERQLAKDICDMITRLHS